MATKVKFYATGSNDLELRINGEEIMQFNRRALHEKNAELSVGDVITICNRDRFDLNSLWVQVNDENDQLLFGSSTDWSCYYPKDLDQWWDISEGGAFRSESVSEAGNRDYTDEVTVAAAFCPNKKQDAQIVSSIIAIESHGYPNTFFYYVVKEADLSSKEV